MEKRKLVPLSCIHDMANFEAVFDPADQANLETERVEVTPMAGTQVQICGLQSLNQPLEIVLIEMSIDDHFPLQDLPIDVAAFRGDPFFKIDIGTVTPEHPLELALCTWGTLSVRPALNMIFWGYETIFDESAKKKAEEEHSKKITFDKLDAWLGSVQQENSLWATMVRQAVRDCIEGKEPDPVELVQGRSSNKILAPKKAKEAATTLARARMRDRLARKKTEQFHMGQFLRDFETLARENPREAANFAKQWQKVFDKIEPRISNNLPTTRVFQTVGARIVNAPPPRKKP